MRKPKIWIFVGTLAALALAVRLAGWDRALLFGDALDALGLLVQEHPAPMALAYVGVSAAACVALAVPGVVFALAAGVLFGPLWGSVLCWIAVVAGACLSFLLGRYVLKDALKPKLERHEALNKLLFQGAPANAVYLLAVTRLVPVFPYNLQNFAYGVTDIGFIPYALYSALFMLPGTVAYTVAAAGLVGEEGRLACFAVAAALVLAAAGAARALRRRTGV